MEHGEDFHEFEVDEDSIEDSVRKDRHGSGTHGRAKLRHEQRVLCNPRERALQVVDEAIHKLGRLHRKVIDRPIDVLLSGALNDEPKRHALWRARSWRMKSSEVIASALGASPN